LGRAHSDPGVAANTPSSVPPRAVWRSCNGVSKASPIRARARDTPYDTQIRPVAFPDVAKTSTFCADVAWLKAQHITTGDRHGRFDPQKPVSRQAMAAFIHRSHE
jgi:hypothetical protein